ncbi:DNA ligase D [Halobacillus sp. A1]|uniref:DNA ligase D n=1 Tax=Halobacillus sp. A1 TaxID=2880262 RepID=UPI0020A64A3B|nr:DNA ligase D [Halobacillus sp. A1]MCP3030903.1 DNA ligase D [Halobacillus sp. A1]
MDKPMLPTLSSSLMEGEEWMYEVKYDGFRAFLSWTTGGVELRSRNGKDLSRQFPEIINALDKCTLNEEPILLDGEIVILNNAYQANFPLLQTRGRMKKLEKIKQLSSRRPAVFMAFDMLKRESDLTSQPYLDRKRHLKEFIEQLSTPALNYVESFKDKKSVQRLVFDHLGEGIVAKRTDSSYANNKRTRLWLKIKEWRTVSGFLTQYNPENDYYEAEIYDGEKRTVLGRFKNGLSDEESQTLRTFFREKGDGWRLQPSICVDINCLEASRGELREPQFNNFRFDLNPNECTADKLNWDLSLFPQDVEYTHTDKQLWPNGITKKDYLIYLRHAAAYMLPYFKDKHVTVIRYPDGMKKQSFFQKNAPDYAPDHVKGQSTSEGEMRLRVEQLSSLLWLGNQGALEFHLPFQKTLSDHPDEIIFDLDPPEKESFGTAILAAGLLKHLLDELGVYSFVKTSGNKGLQIHLPIEEGSMTYKETRKFTEQLALLLVKEKPELFTIERLKKNRRGRLYIDYVQHAEGKTIIAPYSARATKEASVAAPLFWHELDEPLTPSMFTVKNVIERLHKLGCPFQNYQEVRKVQPINTIKKL